MEKGSFDGELWVGGYGVNTNTDMRAIEDTVQEMPSGGMFIYLLVQQDLVQTLINYALHTQAWDLLQLQNRLA